MTTSNTTSEVTKPPVDVDAFLKTSARDSQLDVSVFMLNLTPGERLADQEAMRVLRTRERRKRIALRNKRAKAGLEVGERVDEPYPKLRRATKPKPEPGKLVQVKAKPKSKRKSNRKPKSRPKPEPKPEPAIEQYAFGG
jgi:protein TonB